MHSSVGRWKVGTVEAVAPRIAAQRIVAVSQNPYSPLDCLRLSVLYTPFRHRLGRCSAYAYTRVLEAWREGEFTHLLAH